MDTRIIIATALSFWLGSAADVYAQRQRIPPTESPVVHPDRTVTFNFRAPSAKRVELSAQFINGNQQLKSDGV